MLALTVLKYFFLWLHLFSAMLFIGGSFFMWLVLVPGSKDAIKDEAQRTTFVAVISKRFARITWMLLATLVITGLINAFWYLSPSAYKSPYGFGLVATMVVLTAALIVSLYGPGKHYGRMIAKFAKEGNLEGLQKVRRKSTAISYANLCIMILITVVAVLM